MIIQNMKHYVWSLMMVTSRITFLLHFLFPRGNTTGSICTTSQHLLFFHGSAVAWHKINLRPRYLFRIISAHYFWVYFLWLDSLRLFTPFSRLLDYYISANYLQVTCLKIFRLQKFTAFDAFKTILALIFVQTRCNNIIIECNWMMFHLIWSS